MGFFRCVTVMQHNGPVFGMGQQRASASLCSINDMQPLVPITSVFKVHGDHSNQQYVDLFSKEKNI